MNELAFGRRYEADLVDALRGVAQPQISLVAVQDGRVVGHIFFSPVSITGDDAESTAIALGPVAVLPEGQNRGIGSALVRRGLQECLRLDQPVVFVLGHRHYYPRFGFSPAGAKGVRCTYPVPDDVFMVVELTAGALAGRRGVVRYRPEFDAT